MRILLVEDEVLLAMDLELALVTAGHHVIGPAATAGEGLRLAEAGRPDIALVDINLRDGRGAGIELAREMLARWGTPSLFVSGQDREARENIDAAVGFLAKPFSAEDMIACVEVVRAIGAGEALPHDIPPALELFRLTD